MAQIKKSTAWTIIAVMAVASILAAAGLAKLIKDEDKRRNTTVITCEGDYRVFMRGDQFEVLYDPDCVKTLNRPEFRLPA
jgi:hypothetical protein